MTIDEISKSISVGQLTDEIGQEIDKLKADAENIVARLRRAAKLLKDGTADDYSQDADTAAENETIADHLDAAIKEIEAAADSIVY